MINTLDTYLGRAMNINERKIKRDIINEDVIEWETPRGEVIYGLKDSAESRVLRIPVVIDGRVVFDTRGLLSNGEVTTKWEWDRLTTEAALLDYSLTEDADNIWKRWWILNLQYGVTIKLGRALMLDGGDTAILMNLIALYGLSVYESGYTLEEKLMVYDKYLIGDPLDRELLKKDIEDSAGDIDRLDDVVTVISEMDGVSNRLRAVDLSVINEHVSGLGFGANSAGLIVGLEVPAMWVANAYVIYTNRLYKKTIMYDYLIKGKKALDMDKWEKGVKRIIGEYDFTIK